MARWRAVVLLVLVGVAALVARAAAQDGGSTTVGGGTTDDGATIGVGHTGGGDDGDVGAGGGSQGGQGGATRPRHCDYFLEDSAGASLAAGGFLAGPEGTLAELRESITVDTPVIRRCVWTDTGELESLTVITVHPDPGAVARRAASLALSQLVLPLPVPRTNPPGLAIDNIATFLDVVPPGDPQASATNAGVTATVTAQPGRIVWRPGDGTTVTCPARQRCAHTYSLPTSTVRSEVTVVWHLRWTATNGQTGDLGEVARTATFDLPVEELVTDLRSS